MFGLNMKDQFGELFYKHVSYEEFSNIVKGMIVFAKSQPPVNYQKLVAEAQADDNVRKEMVGPMLRVKGNVALKGIDQFNKFVRMGIHALQLCYYEMEVPELGHMGQLTVVDNYGIPIEQALVPGLVAEFFGDGAQVRIMETPPHVIVAVCKAGTENDEIRQDED